MQVVFGAMADKDVVSMLKEIVPMAHTIHLCAPSIARSMSVENLAKVATAQGITNTALHESVSHAYHAARAHGPTVACGSFHVADEVMLVR